MTKKRESEKTLEARLVEEVKKRGGMAVKLTSQFHRGLPDRLVLLPYHTIAFVEMKSTGEKPTALQESAHVQLRNMRFTVRVVDSTDALNELLAALDARIEQQTENDIEYKAKRQALKDSLHRQKRDKAQEARLRRETAADVTRLANKFNEDYDGV